MDSQKVENYEVIYDVHEEALVDGYSKADLGFLVDMAEELVGGEPTIAKGVDASQGEVWVIIPTCKCKYCKLFIQQYTPNACTNPVRAIRRYMEKKSEWNKLIDETKTRGTVH